MAGYSIKFLPLLAIAAFAFGAVYLYVGVNTIVLGAPVWGVAIAVFGLAGMSLGFLLWRLRRPRGGAVNPRAGTPEQR